MRQVNVPGTSLDFIIDRRWDKECPVCGEGLHIEKDADFPASMMNCEICGSEWNEDETTMNAREME